MPLSPYANISPQLSKMTVPTVRMTPSCSSNAAAGNRDALALLCQASYRQPLTAWHCVARATQPMPKTQCRSHSSIYFSAIQHPAITELRA